MVSDIKTHTNIKSILIVDDEPDLVELVSYNLKKEGFTVSSAADSEEALVKIKKNDFHLIILDLMLPGIQGLELCRILRENRKTELTPIIMLTAKVDEADKIRGLESGADDYITKPFSPKELIARVNAVLRRSGERKIKENVIRVGELTINRERHSVHKKETPIHLSATEFKLLICLVERRGMMFSRDQLLDAVWKDETFVEPRTVDVHISRLRTLLEDNPAKPTYIKTKRGVGYYVE
jgi:phosphate regulon transcriptional regulator PhoB